MICTISAHFFSLESITYKKSAHNLHKTLALIFLICQIDCIESDKKQNASNVCSSKCFSVLKTATVKCPSKY